LPDFSNRLALIRHFMADIDGVAKSPPLYAFTPEKPPGLVGRNFCLAISSFFANTSTLALGKTTPICCEASIFKGIPRFPSGVSADLPAPGY